MTEEEKDPIPMGQQGPDEDLNASLPQRYHAHPQMMDMVPSEQSTEPDSNPGEEEQQFTDLELMADACVEDVCTVC